MRRVEYIMFCRFASHRCCELWKFRSIRVESRVLDVRWHGRFLHISNLISKRKNPFLAETKVPRAGVAEMGRCVVVVVVVGGTS